MLRKYYYIIMFQTKNITKVCILNFITFITNSLYPISLCRGHSWRVRLANQETLTTSRHLVSPLVCRGPWMSTVVLYCWCHCDSVSVILYFTFLSHLFPLRVELVVQGGSTQVLLCPFYWCVVAVTLPIWCGSTSSVRPPYIHFRCFAGIHGGCG